MLQSTLDEIKDCDSLGDLKARIVVQQWRIERLLSIKRISELYLKIKPDMIESVEQIGKLIIENEELKKTIKNKDYIISKLLRKEYKG